MKLTRCQLDSSPSIVPVANEEDAIDVDVFDRRRVGAGGDPEIHARRELIETNEQRVIFAVVEAGKRCGVVRQRRAVRKRAVLKGVQSRNPPNTGSGVKAASVGAIWMLGKPAAWRNLRYANSRAGAT